MPERSKRAIVRLWKA